jgi:hypothetical protein
MPSHKLATALSHSHSHSRSLEQIQRFRHFSVLYIVANCPMMHSRVLPLLSVVCCADDYGNSFKDFCGIDLVT